MAQPARILIVAGSDPGGGAGIQADIKTVSAFGGFATTAITALTAQNTLGVFGVHPVPVDFIAQQISLVLSDIGTDAIKTGMLHSAYVIDTVLACLEATSAPLIVDPVMVAKGGAPLLEEPALTALRGRLIPRAHLLTPNLPEASLLIGRSIRTVGEMHAEAPALLALGAQAVLLKGGHLEGDTVTDLLITESGVQAFSSPRIETRHTHGTGCTLASALATLIGSGRPLPEAVRRARAYVQAAMRAAPGFGAGHGPLWHGVPL